VAHDLRRSRVEVHSVPRVVKKRPHTSKNICKNGGMCDKRFEPCSDSRC
jgi:hypothetical protein